MYYVAQRNAVWRRDGGLLDIVLCSSLFSCLRPTILCSVVLCMLHDYVVCVVVTLRFQELSFYPYTASVTCFTPCNTQYTSDRVYLFT